VEESVNQDDLIVLDTFCYFKDSKPTFDFEDTSKLPKDFVDLAKNGYSI
jgi:hypothetical protein